MRNKLQRTTALLYKPKFCHLSFVPCAYFVICVLSFVITSDVYAFNLEKAKIYFLSGDYSACINEGEKILATVKSGQDIDELYYLLALSYLKEQNYLRASDIFEIIINESRNSRFREEALLGLGDTYLLKGDYDKSESYYRQLLKDYPNTKWQGFVHDRLSRLAFKKDGTNNAEEYSAKLKQEFPPADVSKNDEYLPADGQTASIHYYTVQVGAFSKNQNARNLVKKLIQKGYPAYIEETDTSGRHSFRVRVGKMRLRKEAKDLSQKLTREGYATRIYP